MRQSERASDADLPACDRNAGISPRLCPGSALSASSHGGLAPPHGLHKPIIVGGGAAERENHRLNSIGGPGHLVERGNEGPGTTRGGCNLCRAGPSINSVVSKLSLMLVKRSTRAEHMSASDTFSTILIGASIGGAMLALTDWILSPRQKRLISDKALILWNWLDDWRALDYVRRFKSYEDQRRLSMLIHLFTVLLIIPDWNFT
jgi:hypothetical protein